jgi:tetratricopeptide (TPR) repeat protein
MVPAVFLATSLMADVTDGVKLYQEKNYEEAERVLREAVNADPANAEANHYLGLALLERKKFDESEPFFRKAIESRPDARVGLARALMMQEKLDAANEELDQAATAVENNSELHRTRGMILLKRERYANAAGELKKAVEIDPKDAYAHYYYGMANSRLRKTDLMVKHFQIFLELAPEAPEAAKVRSLLKSL